ncbi:MULTISPECIES: hypothetical protein [Bacillus cereus group]|uniref:hypothetical protein n=1 Tax=Bacillus cereus group TaxID=86661 RepID=UPI00366FC706
MITVFKILLMIVIAISLIGVIGETSSQELRNQMTAICITPGCRIRNTLKEEKEWLTFYLG